MDTPALTATPTSWVLSGVVRDRETGKPLAQAQVSAADRTMQADPEGRFRFPDPIPDLVVQVRAAGYEEQRVVWKGESPLDIALNPERTVILVFDRSSSKPLPGAIITASETEIKTDAQGQAILARLKAGDIVKASREGYRGEQITYYSGKEISLSLDPYVLRGAVRDRLSGDALSGANIGLRKGSQVQWVAVSDVRGRYEVKGIPVHSSVVITASGYLSFTAAITVGVGSSLTVNLEPFMVKGVYIPFGLLSLKDSVLGIFKLVDRTELNAVVVDVKSDRGRLAYQSQVEVARKGNAAFPGLMDLKEFLRLCDEKKIYTIARIVAFKDPVLASVKPEWAIRRSNGSLYVDLEGLTWGDPYRQEVRDYNVAIAKEVAAMGFDEIQFDYLRFPSDGVISDIKYPVTNTVEARSQAIAEFCAQAYRALKPMGVAVSADLFGLVPWVEDGRDMGIGQRLKDIASQVDYISPMLYPSTFVNGNLQLDVPARYPYEVIYRSCLKVKEQTKTKLRPWLQHYSLWGIEYGTPELLAQKRAANDAKTYGWLFWNAGGVYNEAIFEPAKTK